MNSFEFNKIFAAVLVAGVIATFSGFIARETIHPKKVEVKGVEEATGGAGGAVAGPVNPEPVFALIAAADPAAGEKVFKACATCHSVEKGGPDGIGPNLWNTMSRGIATHGGYAYSEAMAAHKGEKWDYDALNHFLWKPKVFVPGTKMTFIGLKKPEDRAAVIAYLRTKEDAAPALPSAAQAAEEAARLAPPVVEEAVPADDDAKPAEAAAPAAAN